MPILISLSKMKKNRDRTSLSCVLHSTWFPWTPLFLCEIRKGCYLSLWWFEVPAPAAGEAGQVWNSKMLLWMKIQQYYCWTLLTGVCLPVGSACSICYTLCCIVLCAVSYFLLHKDQSSGEMFLQQWGTNITSPKCSLFLFLPVFIIQSVWFLLCYLL